MDKTNPEFDAFTSVMDRLVAVPRSVMERRAKEYREQSAKNPRRRGPKPKIKRGVSARASRDRA